MKHIQILLSCARIIKIISAYEFIRYQLSGCPGLIIQPEVEHRVKYERLESYVIFFPWTGKRENILALKTKLMFDWIGKGVGSVVTCEERFIGEYKNKSI